MAVCVVSKTDAEIPTPWCGVHAEPGPCPRNGEPACPVPVHMVDGNGRAPAVDYWWLTTKGQRPLVIHHEGHDVDGHVTTGECPCKPELVGAADAPIARPDQD